MGRIPYRYSTINCVSLDMKWLKEDELLKGYCSSGITWEWALGNTYSIRFKIDLINDFPKIIFNYRSYGEQMDYFYHLVKVPCNLGGYRWAFKCGSWTNDKFCGRIVYKLYKTPYKGHFGCQKCLNIVYESQRDCGRRYERLMKILNAERETNKLFESIHKLHYKGKLTKKYEKWLGLIKKIPPLSEANNLFNKIIY